MPLAAAALVVLWPKVQRDGVGSLVPATALIFFLQFDDSAWILSGLDYHLAPDAWYSRRNDRATGASLWRWQWRWFGRVLLDVLNDDNLDSITYRKYQDWLAASRDFARDPILRARISQAFCRDLSHPDPRIRALAAALSVDPEDLTGSLARVVPLLDDGDPLVVDAARVSLALIVRAGGPGLTLLLEALKETDPAVRRSAVKALALAVSTPDRHDDLPGAYEAVLTARWDPDGEVREQSIRTLACFQSDADAEATIWSAWESEDPYAHRGALYAAVARCPQSDLATLMVIEALGDRDGPLRRYAIYSLRHLVELDRLAEHVDRLEVLVDHEDNEVRDAVRSTVERVAPLLDRAD